MNLDDFQVRGAPVGPVGPSSRSAPPPKPAIGPSFGAVLEQKGLELAGPPARPPEPVPLAGPSKPPDPASLAGPPTGQPPPDIKLSAHAQQRLNARQIQLDQRDWERIGNGIDKAAAKGSKEALVMSDKAALVVSVRNRTVITAVDPASMKDNVFTNIDSAVIV